MSPLAAPRISVIIPFRDRGIDPLRTANLRCVLEHWSRSRWQPYVVDDGRTGNQQFNRSAAYNRAVKEYPSDVYIFAESDMLVSLHQIKQAIWQAMEETGLVVPFTEYRYLSEANSEAVRNMGIPPCDVIAQRTMLRGASIGAINVVSEETMELIGQFDEAFDGNWYDDDAMKIAFEMCAGPTRWVDGPAHHLYHLPGWEGAHLTEADRHATRRNKLRLYRYQLARTPERIRELTAGGV